MTFGRANKLKRLNSLKVKRGGVATRTNIRIDDLYKDQYQSDQLHLDAASVASVTQETEREHMEKKQEPVK